MTKAEFAAFPWDVYARVVVVTEFGIYRITGHDYGCSFVKVGGGFVFAEDIKFVIVSDIDRSKNKVMTAGPNNMLIKVVNSRRMPLKEVISWATYKGKNISCSVKQRPLASDTYRYSVEVASAWLPGTKKLLPVNHIGYETSNIGGYTVPTAQIHAVFAQGRIMPVRKIKEATNE